MATEREIKKYMKTWLADYVDECDEINATGLAEDACANFDNYEAGPTYDIPEVYFEIAGKLAMDYENRP